MMKKTYKVAEHCFSIEAEKDFPFWTLMEECYGPFETDDTETLCLFKMLVDESVCCENKTLIYSNAEEESEGFVVYSVYKLDDDNHYFELRQPFSLENNACLSVSADYSHTVLKLSGSKWHQWQTLNTALNLCYYLAAIRQHTLLLHASAVEYQGRAYLFLGKSGTGKSTHSRMWKHALDGVTLINDDHPIVRMYNGEIIVYGSPWSGKTHCYKNMRVPLGGIIRIIRAPYNKVTRLSPIHSYASVMPSCGGMVWEKEFADNRDATIQKIISRIPCWKMECLPNEDAAKECSKVVTEVWKVNKIKKQFFRNSIMFPEVAKLISEGKSVTMKVKGNSMLPFIKDGDTVKLVKTDHLKLYDIVLARIDDEQYVLHRIIRMKDNQLILMGDGNLKGCERCKVEDVLALATIKVNKKEYDFRSDLHLKKARIWNFLLPIRKYLLFIYKLTLKKTKDENC